MSVQTNGKVEIKHLGVVAKPGMSDSGSQEKYNIWAASYDQDMVDLNYKAPTVVGNTIQECFPPEKRANVKLLDVGAGTGLVAKELRKAGFKNIDALDPNEPMLKVARAENLYDKYYIEYISKNPSPNIADNTYDALTGVGIYAEGAHVPVGALHEMVRVVKPGGYIALSTRISLFEQGGRYPDMLPTIDSLEQQGKIKKIKFDTSVNFYADRTAVVFLFQVL